MTFSVWFYWMIGAVFLALFELLIPGFFLLCFSFAAVLTCLVSLLGVGLNIQLISFIVFTIISLVTIRPLFLKHLKPKEGYTETNTDALFGKDAKVTEEINPQKETGRVKIGGEEWRAVSQDSSVIAVGQRVKVERLSGNKLFVQIKS